MFNATGELRDAVWSVDDLRGDAPARDEAILRLRTHLIGVGWFEVDRRRGQLATLSTAEMVRLVRDAADVACATLLRSLDDYHGQSRFPVWAAKFAIHETAAAARREAASKGYQVGPRGSPSSSR